MYLNTDPIHAGALPISPDASEGMAAAVKRLSQSYREHGYDANGSPVSWLCPCRSSMDRCLSMSCDEPPPDLIEAARDAQGG